ncbi:MAG: ubiquitin-like domain-containing protein [Caldilineales bacterium]|nr:ubiquitin-like domain-containing protein [Caldilineales bacterium]
MATTSPPVTRSWQRVKTIPRRLWAVGMLLTMVLAAGWGYVHHLREVTVVVDGREHRVRTAAQTVSALLAGLNLRPEDRVIAPTGALQDGHRVTIVRARPVQVSIGDDTTLYHTHAVTVGEVLAEAGLGLLPGDVLWLEGQPADLDTPLPTAVWTAPADGLPHPAWHETAQPIGLRIVRSRKITVVDGKALPITLYTTATTVSEALAQAEIAVYEGDSVFPPLASRVRPGQRIVIRRSLPITVEVDGRRLSTRTRATTVGAALAAMDLAPVGLDRVVPPLHADLRPHTTIRLTRVREDILYEETRVPFRTVLVPDDELLIDRQRVVHPGTEGIHRKRVRVRFEDGIEVSRVVEDDWLAVPPRDRVIAYGRKIVPQTLETPEGTLTYWRKMRVYANSYSPARSGTSPSAPWYGRTRIGLPLRKGLVAVDPAVIPMGQRMYVPGYGLAMAADTGGGVRGRHIDLGYEDADYVSWHWWVDIYLLWPPPPAYSINYLLPDYPRFPDRGR